MGEGVKNQIIYFPVANFLHYINKMIQNLIVSMYVTKLLKTNTNHKIKLCVIPMNAVAFTIQRIYFAHLILWSSIFSSRRQSLNLIALCERREYLCSIVLQQEKKSPAGILIASNNISYHKKRVTGDALLFSSGKNRKFKIFPLTYCFIKTKRRVFRTVKSSYFC